MTRRAAYLILPALLLLAACGDDDGSETASASGSASASASGAHDDGASGSGSAASASGSEAFAGCEVVDGADGEATSELHVSLTEYAISVEEDGAAAGLVKIEATNDGAEDHEVVVIEGPLDDIGVEDGVVDESGLVGEIEAFPSGESCDGTFDLAAGTYTLLCAIVDADGHSHFEEGMATEIEVS